MQLTGLMLRTVLAALIALTLSVGTASAQEHQSEPERIIAALMSALDRHDLDRAAAFFASDAQVIAPTSIIGRDAIAQWLPMRFPSDAAIEVSSYAPNGQRVSWMTRLNRGSSYYYPRAELSWDEAVVVDGRISLWTSRALADTMITAPQFKRATLLEPMPPVQAGENMAPTVQDLTPLIALGGGILLAGIAGVAFGVWRRRAGSPRPTRNGAMLIELRDRLRAQSFTMAPRGGARGGTRPAG